MRILATIVLTALSLGCDLTGPSGSVSGAWTANTGGRFSFVSMTLEENGDDITGTACAVSDGIVLYRNVPVSGSYPNLQFTVNVTNVSNCCVELVGTRFSGRQESSGDIIGPYATSAANVRAARFKRADTSICP